MYISVKENKYKLLQGKLTISKTVIPDIYPETVLGLLKPSSSILLKLYLKLLVILTMITNKFYIIQKNKL